MRFKKLSSVVENVTELLEKCNKPKYHHENYIYHIADIKTYSPGSDKIKLIIQRVGKSTFIECTPEEIVENDNFLENFSKKDIRTIIYYACQHNKKFKYKIIAQEYCDKRNKILFRLKNSANNTTQLYTAGEIVLDKNIIKNLSQEDVRSISYIAGHEHSDI